MNIGRGKKRFKIILRPNNHILVESGDLMSNRIPLPMLMKVIIAASNICVHTPEQ
jgi:hypothetical protein